ncbi:MAG: hypothetical protein JHD31_05735 [Rhodoluna sp.]|nr:hypothetical protein [Rhodoluna sp.]
MNRLLTAMTWSLLTALMLQVSHPALATNQSPVTVVNSGVKFARFVPKDLVWGEKSLTAASQAILFQSNEIETSINSLKSKGAVTIVKKFTKNPVVSFPDWKTYAPSISQYTLTGYSESGKSVGTSKKIPSDVPNLASRLVYLRQTTCSLRSLSVSQNIEQCSIVKPKNQTYLRASLRTSLGNGQVMDIGGDIFQQLETCLISKFAFTVQNGVFDCPANARIFGGERSFKMRDTFKTRSYSITIDKRKYTATLTYGPTDLTNIALTGTYESGSVVRFG